MEMVYAKCKPSFNHQYTLSKLKEEGYHIAVCSNSVRNTIEIMMQKANLTQYLDFFISNQDVTHGKPDPEIYQKAIQRLGLQPEECLIVEDNENGIKAALASGAHLFKVETVDDVQFTAIMNRINEIEHA